MAKNPIQWWRLRQLQVKSDRRLRAHVAETDIRDNQRLAKSFDQFPVRLVAVVIADVFMDTDIGRLWRSLNRHLAPDEGLREDRQHVQEFLQRSESKAAGREGLGAIHFFRPGEANKYLGGGHEMRLPSGVDRVGLVLYQFGPGMVMAACVVAAPADLAASVFADQHATPVEMKRKHVMSFQMVETAKTRDLERRIREFAGMDLLPLDAGLIGTSRFPAGTLLVWSAGEYPSNNAVSRDVCRVLGIEAWHWWEGLNRRLYSGVPVDRNLRDRGGLSMIMVQPTSEAEQKTYGSHEQILRYALEDELDDWLPLLLLEATALLLGDEAGRVRERLSRLANSRLRWLLSFGLGSVVGELSDLQYRLQRIRQTAEIDHGPRGFQQFPMMISRPEWLHGPKPQRTMTRSARLARWMRSVFAEPVAPQPPPNLRQAVFDNLDQLTKEGLEEVSLSFDRARLLSQIRSTNVLLGLTAVLALLTLILVLRGVH